MNLLQTRPGCYWQTDDPIRLPLNEAGPDQPQTIAAFLVGHSGLVRPLCRVIRYADLEYMGAGLFGDARQSGSGASWKWTGSAYRYGIYALAEEYRRGRRDVVILRADGSGMKAYVVDELEAEDTWRKLIAACPPELLWNVCSTIAHTYHAGETAGRKKVHLAFLDGRLKKRRKAGRVWAEETPIPDSADRRPEAGEAATA
jgi:hypothetical protein